MNIMFYEFECKYIKNKVFGACHAPSTFCTPYTAVIPFDSKYR